MRELISVQEETPSFSFSSAQLDLTLFGYKSGRSLSHLKHRSGTVHKMGLMSACPSACDGRALLTTFILSSYRLLLTCAVNS